MPGDEERLWFEERRHAAILTGSGKDPKVDIRRCKSYGKQMSTTTVLTLERALRERSGVLWTRYFQDTTERLQTAGFAAAASRWQAVVNFARNQNLNDSARERQYLMHYFFVEQLGRGPVVEVCHKSAFMMNASAATQAATQAYEFRPTVASDMQLPMFQPDPMLMGQMAGLSMGSWPQAGAATQAGTPAYTPALPSLPPGLGFSMPPPVAQPPVAPPPTPPPTQPPPAEATNAMTCMPCSFCGGAKHCMEKCTFYQAARKQHQAKRDAELAAQREAARAAKAAEDANK